MKLLWRGRSYEVRVDGPRVTVTPEGGTARSGTVDSTSAVVVRDRDAIWVSVDGVSARFQIPTGTASAASADEIRSPMTGTLVAVHVKRGDAVARGQVLAVVAAMKMEFRLEASREGKIADVLHLAGAKIELGAVLLRLEP